MSKKEEEVWIPPEKSVEWLRNEEGVWVLVRAWCGASAVDAFDELKAVRAENERLRSLVIDEAKRLEREGQDRDARRLRKKLDQPTSHASP